MGGAVDALENFFFKGKIKKIYFTEVVISSRAGDLGCCTENIQVNVFFNQHFQRRAYINQIIIYIQV